MGYTAVMRIIDGKWAEMAEGLQAIQTYQSKLEAEFGRAVRAGHKQRFRRELSDWQKKRRVFLALAAFAPLSIITLCVTAFYYRQVACVIVYWALLVAIILVTLAVAGRQYIREMVDGKPRHPAAEGVSLDLEGRWWESLAPKAQAEKLAGKKGNEDLLTTLARSLPDDIAARRLREGFLLLTGPAGIWLLKEEQSSGMIRKEAGRWQQAIVKRDKFLRKRAEETTFETSPDDLWLERKDRLTGSLETSLPGRAWTARLLQGGVVFSHPKATLNKEHIQGNRAAYGATKGWCERIQRAAPVDGFTAEMQLEILEVLSGGDEEANASSKVEAERLYWEAVEELRASVAGMVK